MSLTLNQAQRDCWAFSLDLYARPNVENACLELQDRFGLDVVLVLVLCWLWKSNAGADPSLIRAAFTVSEHWQSRIVGPLRAARRSARSLSADKDRSLYQSIKACELEAERAEQAALVAGIVDRRPAGGHDRVPLDLLEAVRAYAGLKGQPLDLRGEAALGTIAAAIDSDKTPPSRTGR